MFKKCFKPLLLVLQVLIVQQLYAQNCTINAGTPQTICENATLTLVGTRGGSSTSPVQWVQVEGPSATITNPSSLTTTVTNLVGGNTYKFSLSTTCSDGSLISDEVAVTVRAISAANAGADVTSCPGTNVVTLTGSSLAGGETAAWAVQGTNNGVTVISPASHTTGITLNGANSGATTVRYTITSAQGCSSYDDVVVTNRGGISAVSAGADVTLDGCYSGSRSIANLSGSFGGGGSALNQQGTWLVVSGPNLPTFTNKNLNNTGVSNLIAGTYVLRWTVAGACVNSTDDMQITVAAAKGAVTTASISATGSPFCDGRTSTLLVGSNPVYANEVVSWTKTGGPGTLSSPVSLTTNTVSGLTSSNTSITYKIQNTVTGCSSTSAATALATSSAPSVTITTASPYRVNCGTSSAVIAFTTTGSIGARDYSVISGPAPGTYPSSWKPITSGSTNVLSGYTSPGTYLVRVRATPSGSACASVFADVTIIVSGNASLSNAGTDQTLACNVFDTQLAGNLISNGVGTWTQLAGPTTATIDNPSAYNANITNMVAGKYTFKWYVSNGTTCPSSEDLVDVVVSAPTPTTSVVGANTSTCAGSVVYLEGNTPVRNEVGTWTVSPSSGVVISDAHNPVAAVTNLQNNTTYTFKWTISNACGTSESSYIISTSSTAGASIADAGADQCLAAGTTSTALAGNNPSAGSGTWTQLAGPNSATIANASLYNTNISGLISGTYRFEWKIAKSGCSATKDTVVISVGNSTAANAGADNLSLCGTSVTLAGNNPAIGVGMWTQVSGVAQAAFADASHYNTSVSGLASGRYTFRWTVSNGACASSADDVVIIASTPPSAANAGTDLSVCNASNATLAADIPTTGTGVWSIVSGPNTPTFSNVSSPTSLLSGLTSGVYTLRWKVSAGETCTPITDDVVVTVLPAAVPSNPSESFCSVDNANLVGNTVVGASGVSYEWTNVSGPNAPTITNQSATGNIAKATGLVAGLYTFKYTINAGACSVSANKTIQVDEMPSMSNAGTLDKSLCSASQVTMDATNPTVGTGIWTSLTKPTGATITYSPDINTANAVVSFNKTGTYVFSWQVVNGTCINQQNVTVQNDPTPSVANAGLDQSNVCGTSAVLSGNAPTAGVGVWSVESGPSTPTFDSKMLNNALVSNMIPGDYTFRWTISSGSICSSKFDDVKITIKEQPTTANAGADQSLCSVYTTQLQGNSLSGGTTGMWTKQSGPASITFDDNINPTATISGLVQGTYVLRWTTTLGTCTSYDEVTVNVYDPPSTASVPADFGYCLYGSNPVLSATLPTNGTGAWSKVSGGNVLILTPNSNTTSLAGLSTTGDYTFMWTVNNGTCPVSQAQVTMTVRQPVTTANAGVSQSLYKKTATVLAANNPTSGVGIWSIVSKPGGAADPTFSDLSSPTATVSGLVPGNYVFRWIIDNGGCSSFDDVEIYNTLVPSVAIGDASVAEGGNLVFTITLSNASGIATSVDYATAVNSGAGYADNTDFTAASGTIVFLPGEVTKTVTIFTNDDNIYEGIETFDVNLSNPTELTISDSKGVGTINDNEAKPTITITTGVSANEGQQLVFKVLLSHPSSTPITVSRKTQDGTATAADLDYTAIATSVVTIPAGVISLDVPVSTTVDSKFEQDETVSVVLSSPSANATLGTPFTGVGTILNDDAKPKISVDNQTVEEGGTLTFNITLTNPSYQTISALYSVASGTATMGVDFNNIVSGTLTFAPGTVSKTVSIPTIQDVVDEDDEQLTISLSSLQNVDEGTLQGIGTITDNDAAPTISISDATVAEGGKLLFTVSLSAASEKPISVSVGTSDRTATVADGDYNPISGVTLSFSPGETSKVVEVQTNDDGKYEGDETLEVNLSSAVNATIADGLGVGTLTDAADIPEISVEPATAAEGSNLSFKVWLSKPSVTPVTVSCKTTDFALGIGKASGGADYTSVPLSTITFAAGTTEQFVSVTTLNDNVYEGDETFKVELSGASSNSVVSTTGDVALGTITDEADKPTISVGEASIAEGGTLKFVVSISNAAVTPITVDYKTEDYLPAAIGRAVGGPDYQNLPVATLTFPANSTASQNVLVPTINDNKYEGDELMKLVLANNSTSNSVIGKASGDGTITDAADYPSLSISNATAAEGDALGFTVTLSNESLLPITVKYSTSDGTATAADGDYTPVSLGEVSFAAGTTTLTSTVSINSINNDIYEGDETLTIALSDAQNATISATGGTAIGTITDEGDKPTVSISDAMSVSEGGDLTFRISLSKPSTTPVAVSYKTVDGSATAADSDYSPISLLPITIPALVTYVDVVVQTTADTKFEGDESVFVELSSPSANASLGAASAKGIILNDDAKPSVSIKNASAAEGDVLTFEVTLSNPSDQAISVDYAENDITATSGIDFNLVAPATITFNPGEVSKIISVTSKTDELDEVDETFTIELSNLVNAEGGVLTGIGTIVDQNGEPALSVSDATIAEGGKLQFTVSLSAASSKPVTVKVSTSDGTATLADNDYAGFADVVVAFAPGETSKIVEVQTVADTKWENDETVNIELTAPSFALLADSKGVGVIVNDDALPAISVADASANEGDKLLFKLTLDRVSVNEVSVKVSTQDNTAGVGDYNAIISMPVIFAPGETEKWVEVTTLTDAIVEGNEQLKLILSDAASSTLSVTEATGTIVDILVKPTNRDFDVTGSEDTPINFSKTNFADNFDRVYLTELLRVRVESLPNNGVLLLGGVNVKVGDEILASDLDKLIFVPNENWNGETSFRWSGQNASGFADSPATATIKIAAVNDLPEAVNDNFTVDEEVVLTGNVAVNDKLSGDGGNLFTLVDQPAHGEVALNSDGTFTYTQKGAFAANDSFTYKLCDANGDCVVAMVNIIIIQIHNNIQAPVAVDDKATSKGDTPVVINILINDSDPDGLLVPSSVAIVDQPHNGAVAVNADGTVTYIANKGYVGSDSFTYRVCDNGFPQRCATASVTVTVVGLDVMVPDAFSPNGDGINDYFVIKGLETYPNNVLRVFNRWGNIVYQKKGYDSSWNGQNGGEGLHIGADLPDGTYFYVLELGDGSKPRASYVVIKR